MKYTEKDAYWWEHLDASQEEALAALSGHPEMASLRLPGHRGDRYTLLRFLKARKWKVDKALAMYRDMVEWRSQQGADKLASFEYPEKEAVRARYPHFWHKNDRWGRPVWIDCIGVADIDKVLEVTTLDRLLQYHVQMMETTCGPRRAACSAAAGRHMLTNIVIADLQGLSYSSFTTAARKLIETISKMDQDNYPEQLGQMYIVNAPVIFRGIWAVIKVFFEERTIKKIYVLGSDYKDTLLAAVPAENLPTFLGGTSACTLGVDVGPLDDMRAAGLDPFEEANRVLGEQAFP